MIALTLFHVNSCRKKWKNASFELKTTLFLVHNVEKAIPQKVSLTDCHVFMNEEN